MRVLIVGAVMLLTGCGGVSNAIVEARAPLTEGGCRISAHDIQSEAGFSLFGGADTKGFVFRKDGDCAGVSMKQANGQVEFGVAE